MPDRTLKPSSFLSEKSLSLTFAAPFPHPVVSGRMEGQNPRAQGMRSRRV